LQNTLDFRGSKVIRLGGQREINLSVDFMNALNSNAAQNITRVSGPTYGQIDAIPTPRAVRLGAQFSY
jgi:hypothetical protein